MERRQTRHLAEHCCPPERRDNCGDALADSEAMPLFALFCRTIDAPSHGHDLIGAQACARRGSKQFDQASSSASGAGRTHRFADTGVIVCDLKLYFCVRKKAQPVANLLRNRHLPLACNLHGITPTSKCNTIWKQIPESPFGPSLGTRIQKPCYPHPFTMPYENILVELREPLAVLTLNRPKVLNALNAATFRELSAALEDLVSNPAVRAILLTGAGEKAFAAGADIQELAQVSGIEGQALAECGQRLFEDRKSTRLNS